MKKFFSSFSSTGGTSGTSGSGKNSCQASEKYQPEKGVPECAGRTAPVVHRGNLRWELADFGSLLRFSTSQPHPSITSARLVLPTEHRLSFAFTVFPKGISEEHYAHVGLRLQVLTVPNKEAGALVSYRLLMLNGKNKILVSVGKCFEFLFIFGLI